MKYVLLLFGLLVLLAAACKKDDPIGNAPPETHLFLDSIALSGPNRLQSVVTLHWSGENRDGFISSYEVSTDSLNWAPTTLTDSTFHFTILGGADTTDIRFWVRAIDNQGAKDPSPAYLRIPVRNTQPSIAFRTDLAPRPTVQSVVSLGWTATDPDGDATIDQIELKINDGSWFVFTPDVGIASLLATDPKATGSVSANIFIGQNGKKISGTIDGLKLNAVNDFYVRCRDQGGLYSDPDTLSQIFVKNQTGDLLVLDNWITSPKASATYLPILQDPTLFGPYDYIDMTDTNQVPRSVNLTLGILFGSYKTLFWYGQRDRLTDFENAESILQTHLNGGGKQLLIFGLPGTLDPNSPIFKLGIADSMATVQKNAVMSNQAYLSAQPLSDITYPDIQSQSTFLVNNLQGLYGASGAEPVYRGEVTLSNGNPWTVSNVFVLRTRNTNGHTNRILSSVPLHSLNNTPAVTQFLQTVKQEFNW